MKSQTLHLALIRHIKSDWEDGHRTDFERTVRDSRRMDAVASAQWLKTKGFSPEQLLCSPAFRTLQTMIQLLPVWELQLRNTRTEMQLYESGASAYLHVLSQLDPSVSNVLIIGHNPSLTDLINRLQPEWVRNLSTSGAALIRFDNASWNSIEASGGKLLGIHLPSKD
jgi:phosphohistidine phosphatase